MIQFHDPLLTTMWKGGRISNCLQPPQKTFNLCCFILNSWRLVTSEDRINDFTHLSIYIMDTKTYVRWRNMSLKMCFYEEFDILEMIFILLKILPNLNLNISTESKKYFRLNSSYPRRWQRHGGIFELLALWI